MQLAKGKDTENVKNWLELLRTMEGQKYMINAQHELLLHTEANETDVLIKTNVRTRRIELVKLADWMKDVMEIDETLVPAKMDTGIKPTVFQSLTDTLMDNIQKIKENPEYISQAQAIATQAKQVVDIARTQVEVFKLTQGVK